MGNRVSGLGLSVRQRSLVYVGMRGDCHSVGHSAQPPGPTLACPQTGVQRTGSETATRPRGSSDSSRASRSLTPRGGTQPFDPAPDHKSTSNRRACDQAKRLRPLDLLGALVDRCCPIVTVVCCPLGHAGCTTLDPLDAIGDHEPVASPADDVVAEPLIGHRGCHRAPKPGLWFGCFRLLLLLSLLSCYCRYTR
jgi:hypothetical protein